MRIVSQLAFWGILAILAFVTLSPIGLRPEVGPANYERCFAYALFGERPDSLTLVGAVLIVGSGLYTLLRSGAGGAGKTAV